ncbi:hypothetical protein H8356DRAFT_1649809 [Neocallimastix lanati (nom. inval.)]|jgi:hypothetical protein|uniref:BTB domain-containing protein n=1 Tax=Neocallimastix californiae TaxID=1754190 RepID=A0A1Y2D5B7_9FUNG|nr:hypothetical protein H8356DRAFT_1649809 [Neocallimastix sp. JGI-2020a]ORY54286.1 hypothetical protein LY90DRAFT_702374 [Neocallimastix californiae]|eukprot:ORY54286.1 hypothetical protein LY90DRAFT_702374 [Neocallimastix californiae]
MAITLNEEIAQLPSPPMSPHDKYNKEYTLESYNNQEGELKDIIDTTSGELTQDDNLREEFIYMMEEGIQINNEVIPCPYFIEKLHRIGKSIINKKTEDAVPLYVYGNEENIYGEFWVHPMFLSLQSFQFFKIFQKIKESDEQDIFEIKVPSLNTFSYVIYYLYTGDTTKILEIAKNDEIFYKGIMENFECLEINMKSF